MEIELKLLVDPSDIEALGSHPALQRHAIEKPHRRMLVSTYFDTPDLRMRQAGASLRVRQTGQGWVQTLKGGGSSQGGLHQRNEWEQEVGGPALDIASLREIVPRDSPWHAMLDDAGLMAALTPIFTTRFNRQIWNLLLPDGTQVECALDTGEIETGKGNQPINELELEIKSGATDALFEFALTLLDDIPLRIGHISKAQRGYALHQQTGYAPVKAEAIELTGKETVEDGFEAVVNSALRQIFANEEGMTHEAHHMESIHQMRVGLRRLSTGFRLFEEVIQVPEDLHQEFRWLTDQLGQARDLQVLATATLPGMIDAAPVPEDMRKLISAVERKAEEAHEHALVAAGSVRHTRLMLNFMRWLTGRHWREALRHDVGQGAGRQLARPLKKFAHRILEKTGRKLLRRGHQVRDDDAHALHRVRIAAKRVRYAAEFFQSVLPQRRARRLIKRCADLQDVLGKMNDLSIGQRLLRELNEPELRTAAAFVDGYVAAKSESPGRLPPKPWKRVAAALSGN